MAGTEHTQSDEDQLTEIVSYLDGELDDSQSLAIEQQLINDPDMRSHADILSRTWALLDELDEVPASQRFTQNTLAAISVEANQASSSPTRQSLFTAVSALLATHKIVPCFVIGLLGGLAGLNVAERLFETPPRNSGAVTNQLLLDNFDLIQRLDAYLAIPNAEALELLDLPRPADSANDGTSR